MLVFNELAVLQEDYWWDEAEIWHYYVAKLQHCAKDPQL